MVSVCAVAAGKANAQAGMLINHICHRRLALDSVSAGGKLPLGQSKGDRRRHGDANNRPRSGSDGFLVQVALGAVDNIAFFGFCSLHIS